MISDITKSIYFKLMYARQKLVLQDIRQNSCLNNEHIIQEQLPKIYKHFSEWAESYIIRLKNNKKTHINIARENQADCIIERENFIELYIDKDIKEQIFFELDSLLLQKCIDLNEINDQHLNQLGYAVIEQDIVTIEWLLSKGQDINQVVKLNPLGISDYALNLIIYNKIENLNMLHFFIKHGANIHQLPLQSLYMWGNKCLEYSLINGAIMYGKLESFKLLIENGTYFEPREVCKLAKIFLCVYNQSSSSIGNYENIKSILDYFETTVSLEVLSGLNTIKYSPINNDIVKEKILLFAYGKFVTNLINTAEAKFGTKRLVRCAP